MASKITGILKLLLALAIPAGIGYLWIYSQQTAEQQVKEFQQNQKEHPDQKETTIDNYQLKEVDDNNEVKWQLVAKQGIMVPTSKDVKLAVVKVEYFDGKKLKMRLSAPQGLTNETTHLVTLDCDHKDRVVCEGEEGKSRLEASKVELNKKNQFTATGGVNILWPGVAKVTGNQAKGTLEHGAELKNLVVQGNTHASIGHIN